jgi:hypothetical protein
VARKPSTAPLQIADGFQRIRQPVKPQPRPSSLFPRSILLLVLLVILDLWSSQHLGWGFSQRPQWLVAIVTSWTVVAALLGRLAERDEVESWGRSLHQIARRILPVVLATPVLVVLWLVGTLIALSYSSVMVLAVPPVPLRDVELTQWTGGRGGSRVTPFRFAAPERFVVRTGPFGRTYLLTVPGYLPELVSVPGFSGLRVVPERDLKRPPTLLLRPPLNALASLQDGGRLRVWKVEGMKRTLLASPAPCNCRASFMLGREQSIPLETLTLWRLELLSIPGFTAEMPQVSTTLYQWNRPRKIDTLLPLRPGMRIQAFVHEPTGALAAFADISLDEKSFIDAPMTPKE